MKQPLRTSVLRWFTLSVLLLASATTALCQQKEDDEVVPDSIPELTAPLDSLAAPLDSMAADAAQRLDQLLAADTLQVDSALAVAPKKDWSKWSPDPQRALWLALVIPGGGQIYNRKYWKLPIVYGGFLGCIYALSWNDMMYKDYSQAYLDIMDDDPGTASYNKFLHLGRTVDSTNEDRYKDIFKKRKDKFRRWRDLSFFVMVGVYALSVIDAYVDAELSQFDISKDLSLKVEPAIMNTSPASGSSPFQASAFGLNCSLHF